MFLEVYESDLGAMRSIAEATPDDGHALDLLVPMSPERRQTIEAFRDQAPADNVFIVNRPEEDAVSSTMLHALGENQDCSILGTYPVLDGKPLGAVIVLARGKDRFEKQHARLLGQLKAPFGIALHNALRFREVIRLQERLQDDNRYLQREVLDHSGSHIIGFDFGLAATMQAVNRVAVHHSPVLLTGETGVGKDVIANYIHGVSPRSAGPMIRLNCGAIPESLLDSELFGHQKGAFTGALETRRGRFERAHGGTIFLDEIGELDTAAQVRLLRILQNKELERVGGNETLHVDVRVIAATNRDLQEQVHEGAFREDLWFRLNVFPVHVPALRDRLCDIPALAEHFVSRKAVELKLGKVPRLEAAQLDRLRAYPWPGNVRELENVIERALILGGGEKLVFDWIPATAPEAGVTAALPSTKDFPGMDDAMRAHIRKALVLSEGRIHGPGGAAERLALNPNTLRSRMRKLGMEFPRAKNRAGKA